MNELFYAGTTVLIMCVMMLAYKLGRIYVIALVAVCLVLSNVIGPKIVTIFGFAITAGTPIFAALPLGTDLLADRYGVKTARTAVYAAFISMLLFILISRPISYLEAIPYVADAAAAVDTILSESLRLMIASPTAYFLWQLVDIAVFSKIKSITGDRLLWLRNNVSTFIAQAGSTFTFFALAFAGTDVPWVEIAAVSVLFYYIIALIDTVFVYAAKHIEPLEYSTE